MWLCDQKWFCIPSSEKTIYFQKTTSSEPVLPCRLVAVTLRALPLRPKKRSWPIITITLLFYDKLSAIHKRTQMVVSVTTTSLKKYVQAAIHRTYTNLGPICGTRLFENVTLSSVRSQPHRVAALDVDQISCLSSWNYKLIPECCAFDVQKK